MNFPVKGGGVDSLRNAMVEISFDLHMVAKSCHIRPVLQEVRMERNQFSAKQNSLYYLYSSKASMMIGYILCEPTTILSSPKI